MLVQASHSRIMSRIINGLCQYKILKAQSRLGREPINGIPSSVVFLFRIGMSRYDLTDFEWRVIEPLLPNKPRGVPRVDDRRVLNGIFWVLRSGTPWRDLPER